MSFFNIVHELSEKGGKLCFGNPLEEPCESGEGEAKRLFEEWRQRELSSVRYEVESEVRKEYEARLQQWSQERKKQLEEAIRREYEAKLQQ
jgi:hypothetical protein